MNHTYFIEIAKFNQWANHVVISWLREISDEQWKAEVISSFNSVGDTAIHIIGAEKIWLQRLQKQSHPEWFPAVFKGTRTEALDAWQEAAEGLLMSNEPVGRKFDFLAQEFNREANTLCSKAIDKSLTSIGLDLKTVIDQMREQVQNIE